MECNLLKQITNINMDVLSILSLILCITILISFALHHLIYKHEQPHQTNPKCPLPPGKTGLPFIGETLDYFLNVRNGVPEKFLRDRNKKFSSQVLRTSLLGQPMAILCGPEGNKLLFSNDNKLVKVWWPSSIDKIFPKPGKEATHENFNKIRKMLPVFLKADALKRFVCTMDSVMKDNVQKHWQNVQVLTVLPIVKKYTFTLACRLLLSIEDPKIVERLEKPMEETVTGTHSLPVNFPGTAFHRAIKSSEIMRREVEAMIKRRRIDLLEKRASPTQDILSHMLLTTDENGKYLCELDIASNIVGLIHGTYATVNTTMTFILKFLAELPDVYEKVLAEQMKIARAKGPGELLNWEDTREMRYSWNVACEVLRLIPPGTGSFREAITDFTYNGYTIPKGWKLHWMHHATQKNPEYFPNPEKFDPSRFEGKGPAPYTYVPFGGGPRMCPGNEYARLVILVFMYNVVTNFKWEKLVPDEKVVHDPLPRPDKGLPVCLHRLQQQWS